MDLLLNMLEKVLFRQFRQLLKIATSWEIKMLPPKVKCIYSMNITNYKNTQNGQQRRLSRAVD